MVPLRKFFTESRATSNSTSRTWHAHANFCEIAARISELATDSSQFKLNFVSHSVSARVATEYAFGVTWYLNNMIKMIKWQLAYARTFFDKGGPGGSDRPDESVFETQLQLAF